MTGPVGDQHGGDQRSGIRHSGDQHSPPDIPRVDDLFSRAVAAQLAEQRAQRETFDGLERRLAAMEQLVTERFGDLSRLLRSGEVEMRLEVLEEEFNKRFGRLEAAVTAVAPGQSDGRARIDELRASLDRRLGQVEDAIRSDDVSRRLAALEVSVTERFGHLEETVRRPDDRIEDLELNLGARFGHLEESLRSEEIGRRLKALELAFDERTSRIEELTVSTDLEQRVASLGTAFDARMTELAESLYRVEARAGEAEEQRERAAIETGALARQVSEGRMAPLDGAATAQLDAMVAGRFAQLESAIREMQERTAGKIAELVDASTAAEAGILERIVAESHVVGAHFQAVRPVVEAMAQAGPDLENALSELRRLAASTRLGGAIGELTDLDLGARVADAGDDASASLFLPPEETPIPERRFGKRRS